MSEKKPNTIVREYVSRPASLKLESENKFTLRSRKTPMTNARYYRKNSELIKNANRLRYQTDPEYRKRCIERATESNNRRKMRTYHAELGV